MKKWMCLLLALVTIFSLTACGEKDEKTDEKTENATQTTQKAQSAAVLSKDEQDALDHALALLETIPYSREGLIAQLVYEGYDELIAAATADRTGMDWKAQAVKAAEEYVKNLPVSHAAVAQMLEYDLFTPEETAYAQEQLQDVDWDKQAVLCAKGYLEDMELTRDELIGKLMYEGFTTAQAEYAADQCGF